MNDYDGNESADPSKLENGKEDSGSDFNKGYTRGYKDGLKNSSNKGLEFPKTGEEGSVSSNEGKDAEDDEDDDTTIWSGPRRKKE